MQPRTSCVSAEGPPGLAEEVDGGGRGRMDFAKSFSVFNSVPAFASKSLCRPVPAPRLFLPRPGTRAR